MNKKTGKYLIIFLLLVYELGLAQEKNPTIYPYGGMPDSSRFEDWRMVRIPLNFETANFDSAHFDSPADFGGAQFHSLADFTRAQFDSPADFKGARFLGRANFGQTEIINEETISLYAPVRFYNWASFSGAEFNSVADFGYAQFHSQAYLSYANFHNRAYFLYAHFHSLADFSRTDFDSLADFRWAEFDGQADFSFVTLDSIIFIGTVIRDKILLGSYGYKNIDLTYAEFIANAKIVLLEPVNLVIQPEKIKYISLKPQLDYFSKKEIIEYLKNKKSFKDNNKVQFELSYIFDKSTMYQEQSNIYDEELYHVWKYPKWFLNTLYYITMGLGYRPFRLVWWVLGLIVIYSVIYFYRMKDQVNQYIFRDEKKDVTRTGRKRSIKHRRDTSLANTIINCFYFSSMLFFTFRLKRDILTTFKSREIKIIVSEYIIGFLIYISFLTLSKSGSILHTLKSLFIG